MRIRNICITLFFLLWVSCYAYSQGKVSENVISFRVDVAHVEPDCMNNAAEIADMISFMDKIQADSGIELMNVTFGGFSSPEGSYQYNSRLAKARRESLEGFVLSRMSVPDSLIARDERYIQWDELARMVEESDISHKKEILNIIAGEPRIVEYYGDLTIDRRALRLIALNNGKVWREMKQRFFGQMRNATVTITYRHRDIPAVKPVIAKARLQHTEGAPHQIRVLPVKPGYARTPQTEEAELHRSLAIKTNALGWGMAITNAAVEMDFGRRWSLNVPVYYSAWNYFSQTVKFRTLAFQPEVRYWFTEDDDGLFTGAHFGVAWYNVATGGEYRTQDHAGKSPALGGGLSLGWRLPITDHWKVEFSLGAGVYSLHYDKFHNQPNGLLNSTVKGTYIGIDQASVSFSYSFNLKARGGIR